MYRIPKKLNSHYRALSVQRSHVLHTAQKQEGGALASQPVSHSFSSSLPGSRSASVKLEINGAQGKYQLESVVIQGLWRLNLSGITEIKSQKLTDLQRQENSLSFNKGEKSAALEFIFPMRLIQQTHVNFLLFITIFSVGFLISYKIVDVCASMHKKNNIPMPSIIFVFLFFLILFIPMLNINTDPKAIAENRRLANYKPLFVENKINNAFGSDFEKWFNDRFFVRSELISFHDRLQNTLLNSIENNKVLPGKDDWLFFKGDGSIANFQNIQKLSPSELERIAQYLSGINNWAKQHDKEFYYVILPDKNKIYGEFYPDKFEKIVPDNESRARQLIDYLAKNTEVKVIYLYDVMLNNKDKGLLYYKTDTHWGKLGAYYGYIHIMDTLLPSYPKNLAKSFTEYKQERGDLTRMTNNAPDDNSIYLKPNIDSQLDNPASESLTPPDRTGKREQIINRAPATDKNLFLMHDCFSLHLLPYLASSFADSDFVWRYNITFSDLDFIEKNSDVIILEQLERYIPVLSTLTFPEVQ